MQIEVVDVGDGACSIISCPDHGDSQSITLIDCGVRRGSALAAAQTASDQLGRRLADVSTVIISHFDADHWRGLLHLADAYGSTHVYPAGHAIQFLYPALPPRAQRLPVGVFALISLRDNEPVSVVELVNRWNVASGGRVRPRALHSGSRFVANDHEWVVRWPPRNLGGDLATRIQVWLADLDEIAHEMAQDGDPRLQDNLSQGYAAWVELVAGGESDRAADRDDPVQDPFDVIEMPPEEEFGDDQSGSGDQYRGVKPELKRKLRRLAARMSLLDNLLSLVVEEVHGEFIGFGDIEGSALKALLAEGTLRRSYRVMLAPHHGTHETPAGFPAAALCISQNGYTHQGNFWKHRDTHTGSIWGCESTSARGTITCSTTESFWPF